MQKKNAQSTIEFLKFSKFKKKSTLNIIQVYFIDKIVLHIILAGVLIRYNKFFTPLKKLFDPIIYM